MKYATNALKVLRCICLGVKEGSYMPYLICMSVCIRELHEACTGKKKT